MTFFGRKIANAGVENTEVYNILCGSVGLTPMPNNGTLHLPLRTIGMHESPDTGLDTPPDPDPVDTTSSATTSLSEAPASRPTKPVLVNPVPTTATETRTSASTSVGADIPDPSPTGQEGNGNGDEDGDEDEDESDEDAEQSLWDWFTGKVDELWNKITGSKKAPP